MNPKVQIIAKDVFTPLLKPLGFKKSRYNYHRRINDVVQFVNLQVSQYGFDFYVNIGWAFDAFSEIHQLPITEKPDIASCNSGNIGIGFRLEQLVDTRRKWPIEVVSTIHVEIYDAVVQVIPYFKTIDSLDAYMQSDLIEGQFHDKALIYYYRQEYEKALTEIRRSCEEPDDHSNVKNETPFDEHWFVNLHKLDKLKPMLKDAP